MNKALAAACLASCLAVPGQAARAGPAATYTLYAAGDIASCAHPDPRWSGAAATAAVIEAGLARNPDAAVLTLGDNVYQRGSAEEYGSCYEPTWGRFKERTYPSPGNHDYRTAGAAGYFGYFANAGERPYYSLTLGNWHVISLDSNLAPAAHAAQLAWLRVELARASARCTLAYWHHPQYSSGGHTGSARMSDAWALLYEAGADIVLSGHDHDYERFAPQDGAGRSDPARGIRQFVVGTGGAYLTPFLSVEPNSESRDNSRTGVLKLVLEDGGYTWEFLEAAYHGFPNGDAPDQGAGKCH